MTELCDGMTFLHGIHVLANLFVLCVSGENLVPKQENEMEEFQGEGTTFFRRVT